MHGAHLTWMTFTGQTPADTICRFPMRESRVLAGALGLLLLGDSMVQGTDWPQFRGATTDGVSPDPIAVDWSSRGLTTIWANGSVTWSNDLVSEFGGSTIGWDNCQSPCLDNDLVFLNLNTAFDDQTLAAFRVADGTMAWSSQNEGVTHTTPVVATIQGVRQVI